MGFNFMTNPIYRERTERRARRQCSETLDYADAGRIYCKGAGIYTAGAE